MVAFTRQNPNVSMDVDNLLNIRWSFCMMHSSNSHMLFMPCDLQKERTGNAKFGEIMEFKFGLELETGVRTGAGSLLSRVQRRAQLTFYLYFIIIIIIWGSIRNTSNTKLWSLKYYILQVISIEYLLLSLFKVFLWRLYTYQY